VTNNTTPDEREQIADRHLDTVLAQMAGPQARPRADQRTAVRALVAAKSRVLVVQATGWGKSAVYWAATSALRSLGAGPTIVISPLLALMRNQVSAAESGGLRAATINSTNVEDWGQVLRLVETNEVDVLLVSPERLANPAFAHRMSPVLAAAGLLVIDEAHCISDWGFDFRPDYQRISKLLLNSPGIPVLATTATANSRVTRDVAEQLGDDTLVLRGSLARTSLRLSVVPGLDALQRYAWVDAALRDIAGSGIIYVPTVAETTRLADYLHEQGHRVAAYSGQLEATERERIEDDLRDNKLKAVVATSALGMGYDKPDLGFCFHVGSPDSPVAYYQQVGRAGRAIDRAEAVLLPAETDARLWEYFATASIPDPEMITKLEQALARASEPLSVPKLSDATGLRRGRLEALLKIMAVDGSVARVDGGWEATSTPYLYEAAKWAAVVEARRHEADLMRHYAAGDGCLMQFLQQALDDESSGPCQKCSVCTGELPPPGNRLLGESVENARQHLRGVDTIIEARKMWPSGIDDGPRGRIQGAMDGRALTFADEPGWPTVSSLIQGPDREVPDDIMAGIIQVLARWRATWPARPVAVVPLPSRHHPRMVRDLATRIGAAGKLPVLDVLAVTGSTPSGSLTSPRRVEHLTQTLSMLPGRTLPPGPLLLVDDAYRSGWTMTVAASILRANGASSVMPLVIQQLP